MQENLIESAPVDYHFPQARRSTNIKSASVEKFKEILFPAPKKRKSLWLVVGRSRRGPEGAAKRPPKGPRRLRPTTSQRLLRFLGAWEKKIKKNFKPQTKVTFYLELSPLQHIKKWALYLKRLRRYGHLKLGIKIWKMTHFLKKKWSAKKIFNWHLSAKKLIYWHRFSYLGYPI